MLIERKGCDCNKSGIRDPYMLPIKKRILLLWEKERKTNKKRNIQEDGSSSKKKQEKKEDQMKRNNQECDHNCDDHDRGQATTTNGIPFWHLPLNKRPSQRICLPRDDYEPILQQRNLNIHALMPWALRRKIDDMGGHEIKLVMQKELFKSDLSSYHNRLSIPENKIPEEVMDFLREEEVKLLETRERNNKLSGVPVIVLDPNLREFHLFLKKWSMTRCSVYNLTHQWNNIVRCNNLKVNDTIQLWSFRNLSNQLCFALVKL